MLHKKLNIQKFARFTSQDRFFWAVTGLLIGQALWIALSGRYPMAFDENFHLGIIRLYASHLSPFWAHQPAGANAYGAVYKDPSYLYQYLMSFPYRLISLFTHNQVAQVIILRFINIGLFSMGFVLFRTLLLKTKISKSLIHLSCLIFVLLPVVPLLAAQINYDNLFLPVVAGTLILTMRFADELKAKKLNVALLFILVCSCLLGSLVKYSFAPIALVIFGFIILQINQSFGLGYPLLHQIKQSWLKLSRISKTMLVLGTCLSVTLFCQRYAINLIQYHNPIPNCGKVMSVKACSAYGPWNRDHGLMLSKVNSNTTLEKNVIEFTKYWFYGMWLRIFFAVDGPGTNFQTRGPLPLPSISAIIFGVIGLVAVVFSAKKLLHRYNRSNIIFLMAIVVIYTTALWFDEFQSYLQTGQPVAINGRYLIPILLPVILMLTAGINEILKKHLEIKVSLCSLVIICLVSGGGALTYILRSNDAWYWPSKIIDQANHSVQHALGPITPGYRNPTDFLPHSHE